MKKRIAKKRQPTDGMRREYDFSKGIRGKYARRYAAGTNVVLLDADVAAEFPTAQAVNETLRAIAALVHRRKDRTSKPR